MIPHLVYANQNGRILEHPHLQMLCSTAGEWFIPDESLLIRLPDESELFFIPESKAIGYNPATGKIEEIAGMAVSAFAAPGHTLAAHPFCNRKPNSPILPLFAYGAVGFANGSFWIYAKKVDDDPRQQFACISNALLKKQAIKLLRAHQANRLVRHIIKNCAFRYGCPAAKNFVLGRYEAPLPTSRACNARCLGCISMPQENGPVSVTPQCRLAFTPDPDEIVEVMRIHEKREKHMPVYSFGQGCEGDPLVNWRLLSESIRKFRLLQNRGAGYGTINCNTNASSPDAVANLCDSGLTSMRVSLNSSIPEVYEAYYRPSGYTFNHVRESIKEASSAGIFVSLNFLFFPGLSDTSTELQSLSELCENCGVSMIQWRNLNIDPSWYLKYMQKPDKTKPMGLVNFMKALKEKCPWLQYGYFNPWLGDRATLEIPAKAKR